MDDRRATPDAEYKSLLMAHIAEEEGLFRGIKLLGAILAALFSVLVWIFIQKSDDIKAMQQTLNQHSIQISETLVILKTAIENDRRQQDSIEQTREQLWKRGK